MPGLLGALVAGGVAGGAEAVNKNVATQNQQTIDENVAAQRAGVEDLYAQAKEQRGYAMAGRYRDQVIRPALEQGVPVVLARQGLYDGTPTPEDIAAGRKQAKLTDIAKAQGIALNEAGINPELAQKGGIDIANAEEKTSGLLQGLNIRMPATVEAARVRNQSAAEVRAASDAEKMASNERISAARLGTLTPGEASKLIGDPLAPPDAVEKARQVLQGSGSGAAPGALGTGTPPGNVDALFPLK